jgi:hypothetical protein
MLTPSGQISIDDLFQESTPGFTGTESFGRIAYESWAQGPLGSNTYTSNGWGGDGSGGGVPVGGNAIYNTGAPLQRGVDPINLANYSNKYYYFDGSIYDIKYSYNNILTNTFAPPPPIINDVNVQVDCFDYNGTYTVHNSFAINANAASNLPSTTIPGFTANSSPLVESVYWSIQINTTPGNTISNIAFSVNGTTVYNAGGGGGNFTWQSAGASNGLTDGAGIIYDVYVT